LSNNNHNHISKIQRKIETLRQQLEIISKDKPLSDLEVLEISNELDKEIVKFMKLMREG
jgi:UDP-N-acetylglucosamine pyrophosphorylase